MLENNRITITPADIRDAVNSYTNGDTAPCNGYKTAERWKNTNANCDDSPRYKLTTLSDVEPIDVRYLWPGKIPIAMFSVIAGNPGVGKSTVALDIACRISRGTPFPGSEAVPVPAGNTVLIVGEDSAQIIRKRVDNAGGDPNRIHILEGIRRPQQDDFSEVRLDMDTNRLDEILYSRPETRLVIIDPLDAFLGEIDAHKKAEVVAILKRLATLAEDRDIAVLGVLHLRKAGSDTSVYKVMGSLGFVSAPRAVWGISKDKINPAIRLMTSIKFNIGPEPSGLSYTIEDAGVIRWGTEPVLTTADEALSETRPNAKTAGAAARKWLLEALAVGPMDSTDLRAAAENDDVSWSTLNRIKGSVGVIVRKKATGWKWMLDAEIEEVDLSKNTKAPRQYI